ncbi:MAG: YdcF family protein [Clostridia bacterium]|nr:YdcF family protein [Clostridia bacterium]
MKVKLKPKKRIKLIILSLFIIIWLIGAYALTVNFYVIFSQDEKIFSSGEVTETDSIDYVVVLGCGIKDGKPSHMLEDRLLEGMAVVNECENAKLILTGDNSGPEYNEVGAMVEFCLEKGFEEDRIVTDDSGFSTGESMENLFRDYPSSRVIIITQKYHLYRALYITERLGIDAVGVYSNPRQYRNQLYFSLREVAARNKDFLKYQ